MTKISQLLGWLSVVLAVAGIPATYIVNVLSNPGGWAGPGYLVATTVFVLIPMLLVSALCGFIGLKKYNDRKAKIGLGLSLLFLFIVFLFGLPVLFG